MDIFELQFLGNSLRQWSLALGTAAGVYLVLRLLRGIFRRRVKGMSEKKKHDRIMLFNRLLTDMNGIFIAALAIQAGSQWLVLPEAAADVIRIAVLMVALYQGGLWVVALVEYGLNRRFRPSAEEDAARRTTINALGIIAKIVVWTFVILIGLENLPNVDVTSLIAGLGIGGIAIGLALQSILGDMFSSLTIALDKPFVLGDSISVGEFSGTIEHVGLKSTRIRAFSGEQLIFSNSDLLDSRIRNYKRMEQRRVVFTLRVVFDTPPEKLDLIPQLIRDAVEPQENARFDRTHFQSIDDTGLRFEVVYYVTTPDYNAFVALQNIVNYEILHRFRDAGIELAKPLQMMQPKGE